MITCKGASWRPRRWRATAAVVGALLAASTLAACSGNSGEATTQAKGQFVNGGTFRLARGTDPGTLSPLQSTSGQRFFYPFLYDTLTARDSSGKLVPELASSWTTKPNSVTYTLHSGVKCQDGTTLTAGDVAAEFQALHNPKAPSPWLSLAMPVPYTVSSDNSAGTVTLTTTQPFGLLANSSGLLPIVCPAVLKNQNAYQHKSDGTGPYQITQYVPDDHYTLTATPGYKWGPDGATNSYPGAPKTIVIQFTSTETTAANELLAGQVDGAQVSGPDRSRLINVKNITALNIPIIQGQFYFNEGKGRVLADEQVRLAVAAALNRSALAKVGTSSYGSVATNFLAEQPQLCTGNQAAGSPSYDPAQAKSILDKDGWVVGSDGIRQKDGKKLSLTIITSAGQAQTSSAMDLAGQELKAVGIDTKIQLLTGAAYSAAEYNTLNYDMDYGGLNLEYPYMYTAFWTGPNPLQGDGSGRNSTSVNNPEFTQLTTQALATPGAAACTYWNEAFGSLLKRSDVMLISKSTRPIYLRNVSASYVGLFMVPTSIKMLK